MTVAEPTPTRAALVRRNTLLLMGAQAALLGATAVWFSLAVVAASDLTGRERWAGVLLAMVNLCAAGSAVLVGRLMDRRGRRPGIVLGHVLLGLAGAGGGIAVWQGSTLGLFLSAAVFGVGMAAALLARAAAADMYPVERRGRVVGVVLSAGTLGAIGGAPLVALIEHVVGSSTLAWALIPAFAAAGTTIGLLLRPDPQQLAVPVDRAVRRSGPARGRRELLAVPPLRAAIAAIVVAHTAMVSVMGVTPVALDDHGYGATAIAVVISLHIAGMYALGPVIGTVLDRYGRRPGLLGGCALSAAGAVIGSFGTEIPLVAVGMVLVGMGWSACYLGATAVVSDLATEAERGSALGVTDLFTSLAAAVGVLASGFVLESAGLGLVGIVMACLMIPVALLVAPLREVAPGRWEAARPVPEAAS